MRFDFIKHHRKEFPLTFMCEHLGVNRSSFYTWCDRPESLRSRTDQVISADIRRLFKQNRQRYGSPRIHKALQDEGTHIGRKRVERLMQKQGLRALHRNRHQPSYRYQQKTPPAANILQRDFSPAAPDTVWPGISPKLIHRGVRSTWQWLWIFIPEKSWAGHYRANRMPSWLPMPYSWR